MNTNNKQLTEQPLMPEKPFDPYPDESALAVEICKVWLGLGPGRNYYILQMEIRRLLQEGLFHSVPSLDDFRKWRVEYRWDERSAKFDLNLASYTKYHAYTTHTHPLAQAWGRVQKLIRMAELLENELESDLWSVTGTGNKKLNIALINSYRNLLDDIAKETGGRDSKTAIADPAQILREQGDDLQIQELTDAELMDLGKLIERMNPLHQDEVEPKQLK